MPLQYARWTFPGGSIAPGPAGSDAMERHGLAGAATTGSWYADREANRPAALQYVDGVTVTDTYVGALQKGMAKDVALMLQTTQNELAVGNQTKVDGLSLEESELATQYRELTEEVWRYQNGSKPSGGYSVFAADSDIGAACGTAAIADAAFAGRGDIINAGQIFVGMLVQGPQRNFQGGHCGPVYGDFSGRPFHAFDFLT